MSFLSLQNISVKFNGKAIIHEFTMDIDIGDKAVLRGDSGSGKSTLLNVVLGLMHPDNGGVFFNGHAVNKSNIKELRNSISWLPQNVNISDEDVNEFIKLPFTYKQNKHLLPTNEEINILLKEFLLDIHILSNKMSEVSIGEKQRLLMIRGLLMKRPILILDEPTASLDSTSKKAIIDFLFNIPDITILSASHDSDWVDNCNKVFEFNN